MEGVSGDGGFLSEIFLFRNRNEVLSHASLVGMKPAYALRDLKNFTLMDRVEHYPRTRKRQKCDSMEKKVRNETAPQWEKLLAGVAAGEPAAERELVNRLWPQVAGRLNKLCPRRSEVEDLAQEVFLRVFTKLPQYRGGIFEAWVDIIARRVCYDALRKGRVRPEWTFSELGDFDASGIEDEREAGQPQEARRILNLLFQKLPSQQAWLLKTVELEQKSIGEVSREMGWTKVAGRLRLLRARRALTRAYDAWEPEEKPKL